VFREVRKEGLPELKLRPGQRALWDNRFAIEREPGAGPAITVRALGEAGLRALKDREALPASLPPLAARALPACWRGKTLLGLPDFGLRPSLRHERSLDCRARFLGRAADWL